jgi:hypothetical protein
MVRTVRYRVEQFLQALPAGVPEAEVEQAMHILPPKARGLFRRQAIQDQRHALAVYHTLRQAGHKNPQLLAAALLHDAGKAAARLPAWQRAVIVLLDRFTPQLLAWLSQGEPKGRALSLPKGPALSLPKGWRRPFIVHAQHPQAGARWAEEAGCSPLTVALIRRHQDQSTGCSPLAVEEDQLLAALRAADNLN